MKKIQSLGALALALALIVPGVAHAADALPRGWYLDVGGLANFETDADSKLAGTTDKIKYGTGWGVSAGYGYAFGNGLRAEMEVTYRSNDVDKVTGVGTTAKSDGSINNTSFMGNVYYDIATGTRFTPYVGAGIGPAVVTADKIRTVNGHTVDSSRVAFAYQGIVGVSTAIDDHWSIGTDYRYYRTTDVSFKADNADRAKTENAAHTAMVTVRYTFNEPEPAPAPIPAPKVEAPAVPAPAPVAQPAVPAVPQSYMVFFDFDKSMLTPEAKRIIAAAAKDYKAGRYVRIVVTGHTDTVGTAKYNKKLSERRATAVKQEFAKLGVPTGAVATVGVGKKGLLVPTADGVREAQNRRAEIVFDKQ